MTDQITGMIPLLYAVICLHHMCTDMLVPTDSLTTTTNCPMMGSIIAQQYVPKPWRFVGFYCVEGRNV